MLLRRQARDIVESHYPYSHYTDIDPRYEEEPGPHATHAKFETDNGEEYRVQVHNVGRHAHVDFFREAPDFLGVTGTEPHTASKVFGTVKNIIKDHLAKHPKVSHVSFQSDNDEPSRIKLYRHMAKRIDSNFRESSRPDYTTQFTVNANKFRKLSGDQNSNAGHGWHKLCREW